MNGALQILKPLALAESKRLHPNLPDYVRSCHNYTDRTANGLTRCIIDYLRFKGHQAERVNCTGRPLDNSKVVADILGNQRRIGSAKWIPASGTKGTADISAVIAGKAVKIEVKMKDKQSQAQHAYQESVERAGGAYWLVRSFDEFLGFMEEALPGRLSKKQVPK